MPISIRRGVFETNSSSTHAIVFRKMPNGEDAGRWTLQEGLDQLRAMGAKVTGSEDGWCGITVDLSDMKGTLAEFYRSEEAYNEWGMKLLYAIVSFSGDSFLWKALLEYLRSVHIEELVLKATYTVHFPEGRFGDIDHDSVGALGEIFGRAVSFGDYLTRKDIYLMIDNEG